MKSILQPWHLILFIIAGWVAAVFGFRAAGPAMLANERYFEQRFCFWNPESIS